MIGTGKHYAVVNFELRMSAGKVAAQVAHAVSRLQLKSPKVMIVLQANAEQLHNLKAYLDENKIKNHLYIDEGVNEVPPMSATVLAFGKFAEDFTPDFIKGFQLYKKGFFGR